MPQYLNQSSFDQFWHHSIAPSAAHSRTNSSCGISLCLVFTASYLIDCLRPCLLKTTTHPAISWNPTTPTSSSPHTTNSLSSPIFIQNSWAASESLDPAPDSADRSAHSESPYSERGYANSSVSPRFRRWSWGPGSDCSGSGSWGGSTGLGCFL